MERLFEVFTFCTSIPATSSAVSIHSFIVELSDGREDQVYSRWND
jgi:hypothetical protein